MVLQARIKGGRTGHRRRHRCKTNALRGTRCSTKCRETGKGDQSDDTRQRESCEKFGPRDAMHPRGAYPNLTPHHPVTGTLKLGRGHPLRVGGDALHGTDS